MWTGIGAILVGFLPVLLLAAGCLRLAFHLAKADAPSFGACVGWVFVMGGAARGGVLAIRDFVAPRLGEGAGFEVSVLQAIACLLIPFFALRLFVCEETGDALRVHALNLALTGLLTFAGFAVYQQLA